MRQGTSTMGQNPVPRTRVQWSNELGHNGGFTTLADCFLRLLVRAHLSYGLSESKISPL